MEKTSGESAGSAGAGAASGGKGGESATDLGAEKPVAAVASNAVKMPPRTRFISKVFKTVLALVIVSATLFDCWRYARPTMYSLFQGYDDEGASLMTLDQLNRGHVLYDEVTTMYGPIGFFPRLAIVKALHLTVNHNNGRLVALGFWMLISLCVGLIVWRLSGSILWFVPGAMAACMTLEPMNQEPGHPQDICATLIALAALSAAMGGANLTPTVVLLGVFAGLLCMTKINLGSFLVAGVGIAMLCQMPLGGKRKWILGPAGCVMAACPILLMMSEFSRLWPIWFSVEISLALTACYAVAVIAPTKPLLRPTHFLWCAAGFVLTVTAVTFLCFWMGVSAGGLFNAVFILPIKIAKSFLIPSKIGWETVTVASVCTLAAIATAIGFHRLAPAPKWLYFCLGIARIVFAAYILANTYRGDQRYVFECVPVGVWLVLAPISRRNQKRKHYFGRLILAFVALFEALWAYPVFGSQLALGQLMEVAVAVIALADGIATLTDLMTDVGFGDFLRVACGALVVGLSFYLWDRSASSAENHYAREAPLDLPGSEEIRIGAAGVKTYQLVTANLQRNADVFYTAPGLYSFNFWTGIQPPTSANATGWMYILTDEQQNAIVKVFEDHPRACFLYDKYLVDFWMQTKQPREGPLLAYVHSQMRLAYGIQGGEIWVHKDRKYVEQVNDDGSVSRLDLKPVQ